MPSRIRRAIAAVKDHTSISLAKVKTTNNDTSKLEVAILKATTHDEGPIDERCVTEVLQYVSSNKSYAATCARAIGRRIGRTSSWVVALKSLMLVLRVFQDGDPHFPKEVLHAMKRGYKILNLSSFRDDSSSSCPWDFTAFVRTFALYLDERLDCFVTGKLQRRMAYSSSSSSSTTSSLSSWRISQQQQLRKRTNYEPVRDMKPAMLLDRISYWQRLLERAIATRPTGAAKTNRLAQTCLYAIVQESFDLYRDISDGLVLLLDSFFHLQYSSCVSAFQTCCKASKQFEELCKFYDLCKGIGVGRSSEYPSVQKISDELLETLQEFLKDQSSFTSSQTHHVSRSVLLLAGQRPSAGEQSDRAERVSDYGSVCTSLEDLISTVDAAGNTTPARSLDGGEQFSDAVDYKQSHLEDFFSTNDNDDGGSVRSDRTDQMNSSALDLLSLDGGGSPEQQLQQVLDLPPKGQEEAAEEKKSKSADDESKQGWELVLLETAATNQSSSQSNRKNDHQGEGGGGGSHGFNDDFLNGFGAEASSLSQHQYNPFLLLDAVEIAAPPPAADPIHAMITCTNDDLFTAFADNGLVDNAHVSTSSSTRFDGGNASSNASIPVDLFPDFSFNSGNTGANGIAAGFPANFPANSSTSDFSADFGNGNGNGNGDGDGDLHGAGIRRFDNSSNGGPLTGFLDDFGIGSTTRGNHNEIAAVSPTGFGNDHANSIASVEPTFHASLDDGNSSNNNATDIVVSFGFGFDDPFSSGPASQSAPTFHATGPVQDQESTTSPNEDDPFSFTPQMMNTPMDQQAWLQQQQSWLQNQNKIIAKRLS